MKKNERKKCQSKKRKIFFAKKNTLFEVDIFCEFIIIIKKRKFFFLFFAFVATIKWILKARLKPPEEYESISVIPNFEKSENPFGSLSPKSA